MMSTPNAILLTQLPIAIGIFWGVIEIFLLRKSIIKLIDKLSLKK
jgi:hypothetical protein